MFQKVWIVRKVETGQVETLSWDHILLYNIIQYIQIVQLYFSDGDFTRKYPKVAVNESSLFGAH